MAKGNAGYAVRTMVCETCGTATTKRQPPSRRFCSRVCYHARPNDPRRTGEERACEQCGGTFYVPRSRVRKGEGRFCSLDCHNRNQGRRKTSHTCKMCGSVFHWSPSRTASGAHTVTYCSLACRDDDPDVRARLLAMNADLQRGRMTGAERMGYALLELSGCDYEMQRTFGGKFTPDAVVPDARLVIQFDGDYWHDRSGDSIEPRILRRVRMDRSQDAYVRACGWEVARFWESDLRNDFEECTKRLSQHLDRPLGDAPALDPLARV